MNHQLTLLKSIKASLLRPILARSASKRNLACLLLEDCTESYFPEFKQATLDMIRAQGALVGWTCTSLLLLQSWASP